MSETEQNTPYDQQGAEVQAPRTRSLADALRQVNARMVLGVLAAVALIVFIAQNTDEVPVDFLGWDWHLPLFLLLLITAALSVVCAEIARWYKGRRRGRR